MTDTWTSRALAHEKVGHTGQGLWHNKNRQLPAYIQHIANDLRTERGMPESEAIATAISLCKKWAAGGKDVHPDTRVKAAAAVAEWERLKAGTHAKRSGTLNMSAAEEILRWNPSQQRVPAGGAGGGQFAAGSSGAAPTNAKPVGAGEAGKRVSDLQKRLNALGAHLAVDGKFGPKTLAAVRAFQKAHGLKVDGLVGPKTTAALRLKNHPGHHAHHAHHHRHAAHHHRHATHHHSHTAPAKPSSPPAAAKPSGSPPAHPAMAPVQAKRSGPVAITAARADNKPYGNVKYADPKNGKYPIDTADHARSAWSYINMPKNAAQYPMNGVTLSDVKDRIKAACKKYGIDVGNDSDGNSKGDGMQRAELLRTYPLEDIHILTRAEGDGSGRVVEAYATVFDTEAEIRDHQGHYREVIDRSAFDQVLHRISRTPGGLAAQVKVLFNHGRTMGGVEAPEFQLPLGKPLDVRPERRGLLTRTEYDAADPFTERVLSKIHAGTITAQSFVGGIVRSTPELRGPGDRYRGKGGVLPTVRRMVLGLREYGPVLYPAYSGAEILGVRMSIPGGVLDDEEFEDVTPDTAEVEEFTPDIEGDDTGGTPEEVHPTRDHAHRLYALRTEQMCRDAGIASLKGGF